MQFVKLLLVSSILSIIPGQLVRIPLANQTAITLSDLFVVACDITFLFFALTVRRSLKLPQNLSIVFLLFILAASASTVLSARSLAWPQVLVSALFLLRFIIYFFLAIVVYNVVRKQEILSWIKLLIFTISAFMFLGFAQLVIFPDLSFLSVYGWDPHQLRIASTLLDPNFTGAVFVFLLAFSTAVYLELKRKIYLFLALCALSAIVLTFSRSSYLAAIVAMFSIGILKSPKALILTIVFFAIAYSSVPQVRERVIGAATIDETAKARIKSWQNAATVFSDNLIFGVGFNSYRYAQANYGFIVEDDKVGGHSGAGSDSSFLLVAATTGILGFSFFTFLNFSLFKIFSRHSVKSYLHLASLSAFLGLLVHSQFVNSFFFPQIMLVSWFIVGLVNVYDN